MDWKFVSFFALLILIALMVAEPFIHTTTCTGWKLVPVGRVMTLQTIPACK